MRIYIHTDLEGVSGICEANDAGGITPARDRFDTEPYWSYRQLLVGDLNAAVEGAFAGGATAVTALDAHGGAGGNFIEDRLDSRIRIDRRTNGKPWGELGEGYDGTFFIGAHAMAGTLNGFLDHTISSARWFNYWINGRRMGELAQWALVAGRFHVPMLMVSGDEAACVEARNFFDPIETASVKTGQGRNRASGIPLDEARARIREAARKAMGLLGKARPFRIQPPLEFTLEFMRSDYCDAVYKPGLRRVDARTLRWVSDDPLHYRPDCVE